MRVTLSVAVLYFAERSSDAGRAGSGQPSPGCSDSPGGRSWSCRPGLALTGPLNVTSICVTMSLLFVASVTF